MRTFTRLLLVAMVAAPAGSQGQPSHGAAARIGVPAGQGSLLPGDVVRITVWRKPELSGDFTVAADSTIKHPLYRDLKIAGMRLADAEGRLRTFLGRYEANPQVLIEPLLRVTLGGEVRIPNLYTLPPETTIAQAVALGGGATIDGRLDQVRVVRAGDVINVNLMDASNAAGDLAVRSGDQILVGRKRRVFRDIVGPVSSLAGAIAAIATLMRR
jgi:protein involved in polysaccharide export with SLBB domain